MHTITGKLDWRLEHLLPPAVQNVDRLDFCETSEVEMIDANAVMDLSGVDPQVEDN